MHVMPAGDGYKYLLGTVGDCDRSLSTPLTRCYNVAGTPPGRWLDGGRARPVRPSARATRLPRELEQPRLRRRGHVNPLEPWTVPGD